MKQDLYNLIYCSKNCIRGGEAQVKAELQNILAASRKNNTAHDITGALLYNGGNFAQVLEGPLAAIERTFEKIQCDPRHTEVNVLHNGPAESRNFPEWSMAFAGAGDPGRKALASSAFEAAFNSSDRAGEQVLALLRELVVQEEDWLLLESV